jgi:hypothetical protein
MNQEGKQQALKKRGTLTPPKWQRLCRFSAPSRAGFFGLVPAPGRFDDKS